MEYVNTEVLTKQYQWFKDMRKNVDEETAVMDINTG